MKNRFLVILILMANTNSFAMVKPPQDPLTRFFSIVFGVDAYRQDILKKQQEALELFKSYGYLSNKSLHEVSIDEIKKSYKKISLKNHPDKFADVAAKAEADERFKKILAAHEAFIKHPLLDENHQYYAKLSFLRIYSRCMVAVGAAAVVAALYHAVLSYKIATPRIVLHDIRSIANQSIDRIEKCSVDRYEQADALAISARIDLSILTDQLPATLVHDLNNTVAIFDRQISLSFTKVAWSYYDCSSLSDLSSRDPLLVSQLEQLRADLNGIVAKCESEIAKQSASKTVKVLKFSLATAAIGLVGVGIKFAMQPQQLLGLGC